MNSPLSSSIVADDGDRERERRARVRPRHNSIMTQPSPTTSHTNEFHELGVIGGVSAYEDENGHNGSAMTTTTTTTATTRRRKSSSVHPTTNMTSKTRRNGSLSNKSKSVGYIESSEGDEEPQSETRRRGSSSFASSPGGVLPPVRTSSPTPIDDHPPPQRRASIASTFHHHPTSTPSSSSPIEKKSGRRATIVLPATTFERSTSPSLNPTPTNPTSTSHNGIAHTLSPSNNSQHRNSHKRINGPSEESSTVTPSAFDLSPSRKSKSRSDRKGKSRAIETNDHELEDLLDPIHSLKRQSLIKPLPTSTSYPRSSVSTDSIASTSTGTRASSSQQYHPKEEPSLQQLLQTVDLNAALKLVQTLQAQLPTPVPTQPATLIPPPPRKNDLDPLSSIDTPTASINPIAESAPIATSTPTTLETGTEKTRRRSLSVAAFGKRNRNQSISSPVSPGSNNTSHVVTGAGGGKNELGGGGSAKDKAKQESKESQRILDERIAIGEVGRTFEDQISKVHLSLSPSTLRRASNCAKYLTMRYSPIYSSFESNHPPPNLLSISRWRAEKEEVERQIRKSKLGSGQALLTAAGGGDDTANSTSAFPVTQVIPPYGHRRNKNPKAWEIYPEEIQDFVNSGGKVIDPLEVVEEDQTDEKALDRGDSNAGSLRRSNSNGSSVKPLSSSRFRSSSVQSNFDKANLFDISSRPASIRSGSESIEPHAVMTTRPPGSPRMRSNESIQRAGSPGNYAHVRSSPSIGSVGKSPLGGSASNLFNPKSETSTFGTNHSNPDPYNPSHNHQRSTSLSTNQILPSRISSGISRQFGRIRNRNSNSTTNDWESSDGGGGQNSSHQRNSHHFRNSKSIDVPTPEGSDIEFSKPSSGQAQNQGLLPSASLSKRPKLVLTTMLDQDSSERGYKSSGNEQEPMILSPSGPGRSRRVVAAGGKMLSAAFKSVRAYPDHGFVPYSARAGGTNGEPLVRRIIRYEVESDEDDEGKKPPREVLDLDDDRIEKLIPITKSTRTELERIEQVLVSIPHSLKSSLEELSHKVDRTQDQTGFRIEYHFPRLPASVIASIAHHDSDRRRSQPPVRKRVHYHRQHAHDDDDDSFSESSSSESDTDSDSEDGNKSDDEEDIPKVRFDRPRRGSSPTRPSQASPQHHQRGVTDSAIIQKRARAATLSVPSKTVGFDRNTHPGRGYSTGDYTVDPLKLLEHSIDELEFGSVEIEKKAEKALEKQRGLEGRIKDLVKEASEVVKAYETANYEHLRPLEENVSRVQALFTRPSSSIDTLWALLSYILTVCFWCGWLVVTTFRITRALFKVPIEFVKAVWKFIRWLLFIS